MNFESRSCLSLLTPIRVSIQRGMQHVMEYSGRFKCFKYMLCLPFILRNILHSPEYFW